MVEILRRRGEQVEFRNDAGIGDQHVDPSEVLQRARDDRACVIDFGHVADHRADADPGTGDQRAKLFEPSGIDIV